MTVLLKQSTATTIVIGPFVDDTDGKTAETGLTISQGDVLLWKQGGTTLAQKTEATSATHRSNGLYTVPLDTTDTNTLGQLIVSVNESGALPVRHDFQVVTANVWDSLFSTDVLDVSVTQWLGTAAATPTVAGVPEVDITHMAGGTANVLNLNASASTIVRGTVDNSAHTPSATEFEADDITTAAADFYNGRLIIFTSGSLANQAARINDYSKVGSNGHFTVSTLTSAPANNDTFVIV